MPRRSRCPAMAAPVDWQPSALAEPAAQAPPLGFEIPGESFPGSAFYYLDDLPNLRNPADPGPADGAELALSRPSAGLLDSGPAARALRLAGTLERPRPRAALPDPGDLLRSGERARRRAARGRAGGAQPRRPSGLSRHRLRRGVPGFGAVDRMPVQLHLRRRAGAQAGEDVVGPRGHGRARGAGRRGLRPGRPRDALPHRADPPLLGRQPRQRRHDRRAPLLPLARRRRAFGGVQRPLSRRRAAAAPHPRAAQPAPAAKPIRWRSPAPTRRDRRRAATPGAAPPRPTPPKSRRAAATRCSEAQAAPPSGRCARNMRAAASGSQPAAEPSTATANGKHRQHSGNHCPNLSLGACR